MSKCIIIIYEEGTARKLNAQANLNVLRKLCLNIFKLVKPIYNKSLKMIRFILGQDFENEIGKVLCCINIDKLKKITEKNQ